MKLFIDDIRNAPDDSWVVARTVTSAIRAISQFGNEIETISLDHDISHQVAIGKLSRPYPCDECFCAVAYFIKEFYGRALLEGLLSQPKIVIHTSNPAGGKEMAVILGGDFKIEYKLAGIANRLEMEL